MKVSDNVKKYYLILAMQLAVIFGATDVRIGHHVRRTGRFVEVVLDSLAELNIYEDEMKKLDLNIVSRAAQLHDIGKLKISDNIICKPGKFTPEEYEKVKVHTLDVN